MRASVGKRNAKKKEKERKEAKESAITQPGTLRL
jgi:hypothetical protein